MNLKLILKLLRNEANLVLGDKSIFLVLFIAPFLYLFLIGTTYINKDEEKVSIGIVDLDRTNSSRAFLNKLNATQKVAITHSYNSLSEAKSGLFRFDIQGVVNIPRGFEKKLKTKEVSPIGLILNNTKFLPSNDINKAVNSVALDYAIQSREAFFKSKEINPTLAREKANPITVQVNGVYNPTNNYGNFLLPFVLLLILHQTLLIGMSESIASDRENGIMQISFLESEHNFLNYIIGKTGFYFFLFLTYLFFTFLVVFPLLDISIIGSIVSLLAVSSIFLLATILYSWFISSFFSSETRAMEVFALTSYPIFLITGVTWSINEMPLFIQLISNLIPLNPYFVFLKKLAVMGATSHLYLNEIIHLLILVFIGFIAAYLRFCYLRKKYKQRASLQFQK